MRIMSVSWKPLKRSLCDHRAWTRSLVVLALIAAATGSTTTDSQSTEVSHVGSHFAFRDYLSMPAHIILITVHLILNSTAYLFWHSPYNSHGTISDHCKFSPDLSNRYGFNLSFQPDRRILPFLLRPTLVLLLYQR